MFTIVGNEKMKMFLRGSRVKVAQSSDNNWEAGSMAGPDDRLFATLFRFAFDFWSQLCLISLISLSSSISFMPGLDSNAPDSSMLDISKSSLRGGGGGGGASSGGDIWPVESILGLRRRRFTPKRELASFTDGSALLTSSVSSLLCN